MVLRSVRAVAVIIGAVGTIASSACGHLAAQAAPTRLSLGKPELVSEYEFTSVGSAVRFANGNILVADPGAKEMKLVDGKTGVARVVGRQGSGPGEYRGPQRVLAVDANQALMFDARLRRAMRYDADGKAGAVSNFPAGGGGMSGARSIDAQGRVFFTEPVVDFKRGAMEEYANIAHWRFGDMAATTVRPIATYKFVSTPQKDENGKQVGLVSLVVPWSMVDAHLALRDGSHVVARAERRVVEWTDSTGKVRTSQPFPGAAVAIPDSVRTKTPVGPLRDAIGKVYPPFEVDFALRSQGDRVWLNAPPRDATGSTWYGFRRNETAPLMLRLPPKAYLIGVFEPFYLVIQRDADDLERLEVYRAR